MKLEEILGQLSNGGNYEVENLSLDHQELIQEAYELGLDDGYEKGYWEGYDSGHDEGRTLGNDEGYEQARNSL